MRKEKFAVILGNVGSCSDRYCSAYGRSFSTGELFDRVASIEEIEGVELVGNWHIRKDNAEEVAKHLERTGLKCVSIIPDHFGEAKWKFGAFTSKDPEIRKSAIAAAREMIDIAAMLDCPAVSLWPGQDGFDYCFQSDYLLERQWLTEGIRECCEYNPRMNICLEYKPKEPRQHSHISRVADTLLLVNSLGVENAGITIDVGHSFIAYENVAEAVALCKHYGDRLMHMHFNDNYRYWDDDMIAGSVHTVEFLELFYWLNKTGYDGWYSMDQFPYREDGAAAVRESVKWLKAMISRLRQYNHDDIEAAISGGDATCSSALARSIIFGDPQ
jgi:sugar phosphate isomerase/epimerase